MKAPLFIAAFVLLNSVIISFGFAQESAEPTDHESDSGLRVWHDQSGFFSLRAELVGVDRTDDGPVLRLKREDGDGIVVPYKLFAKADQEYSVEWYKERKSGTTQKPPSVEKSGTQPNDTETTGGEGSQDSMSKQSLGARKKSPRVGDRVQIQYGSQWYKGEVIGASDGKYKFRYDGYSSSWDEWKTKEQLRWEDGTPVVPGGPSDPNAKIATTSNATTSGSDVPSVSISVEGSDGDTAEPLTDLSPAEEMKYGQGPIDEGDSEEGVSSDRMARSESQAVDRKLPMVGDRVQIKWGSSWWKGEIVSKEGNRFRFRYDGYGESSDEWKTVEHLRWENGTPVITGGPADPGTAVAPEPNMIATGSKTDSKTDSEQSPEIVIDQSLLAPAKLPWDEEDTATTSRFPPGLSPVQTLEYLKGQAMEGNLQAFWDWMPDELRDYVTSDEQRANLATLDEVHVRGVGAGHFLVELVNVMRTKKDYVLASAITRLLLEEQSSIDAFTQVYEPSTSLLESVTELISSVDEEMRGSDFDSKFRNRCDEIGVHLSTLLKSAPETYLDEFWNRFQVESGPAGNTLTLVYPTGVKKQMQLTRVNGRWIPRPLVESLLSIPDAQRAQAKEIRSLSKSRKDGRAMGAGMAQGFKDANYMSIAEKLQSAASSQTQGEFDAAMQNVLIALQAGGLLGG